MLPPPSAGVLSLDVPLRPEQLVAAWRADARRLVLELREPLRVRQRVAARISVSGRGVAATITARVTGASRDDRVHRVELAPDDMRHRALERLLEIARGEVVAYLPRVPRYLAILPAVVDGPAGPTYMNTFSVSENGCGLAWSGPVPAAIGARLDLRLGAGSRAAALRGVVCWASRSGSTATVGVRFVTGAKDSWASILQQARLSGALPA